MLIKITCPACAQTIEAPDEILSEETITCPTCAQVFKLAAPKSQPPAAPDTHKPSPAMAATITPPDPAARIESLATFFTLLTILCVAVGVMGIFIGFSSAGSADALGGWEIAGGGFSLALFLFLISQVVHIRALLAKKR